MSALEPNHVYRVVEGACSPSNSAEQQREHMKNLEQFEACDGFVTALAQIIPSYSSISTECRLMSSIILKNICTKCWVVRGGALRPMTAQEKLEVQSMIVACNQESDRKVVVQLSIIAAKIARHEWPGGGWSEMFPFLINSITPSHDAALKLYGMTILNEVVIELSKKTMARQQFLELCVELFPIISTAWLSHHEQLSQLFVSAQSCTVEQGNQMLQPIENLALYSTASIVILTKLLELSFEVILRVEGSIATFFGQLAQAITALAAFVRIDRSVVLDITTGLSWPDYHHSVSDLIASSSQYPSVFVRLISLSNYLLNQLAAIPIVIQRSHPLEIVPFLESFLIFYGQQLAVESADQHRVIIKALSLPSVMLLSNVISCEAYKPMQAGEVRVSSVVKKLTRGMGGRQTNNEEDDRKEAETTLMARSIQSKFFTSEQVAGILDICLRKLLAYSSLELEDWATDPESFFSGQQQLVDSDTIKCASEQLFLGLLQWDPAVVITHLARLLQDTPRQSKACSLTMTMTMASNQEVADEIQYWDAVYLCAGLSVSVLSEHMDASEWLTKSLSGLFQLVLSSPGNGALQEGQQLLRARLMWLLSCWLYHWDESVLTALTSVILNIFRKGSGSDLVVMLTSLETLRAILSSNAFSPTLFSPIILELVEALCALVGQLTEHDSRARVIEIISEIAIAMGPHIQPMVNPLTGYLGSIWSLGEDHSPLRAAILQTLACIVKIANASSIELHGTILPLINFAIAGAAVKRLQQQAEMGEGFNNEDDVESYLFEDGIALWLAVMRNTTAGNYSLGLNNLLITNLPIIFGEADESKASCRSAEELKDVGMLVEAYGVLGGAYCLRSCSQVLQLMFDNTVSKVPARVVPYLMRPIESFFLSCSSDTCDFIHQSGILSTMLLICCASMPGLRDQMEGEREAEVCIVAYLSIVARVIVTNPELLTASAAQVVNILQQRGLVSPNTSPHSLISNLIRLMLDMFDYLGSCSASTWRKKLWSLAFLSMYPSADETILEFLPEVVNCIDQFICQEIAEAAEQTGATSSSTLYGASMVAFSTEDSPFNSLEAAEPIVAAISGLMEHDVVFMVSLKDCTREKLNAIRTSIGDILFQRLLQSLSPQTVSRLS